MSIHVHRLAALLSGQAGGRIPDAVASKVAVVLLNVEGGTTYLLRKLWANCKIRMCADGAANRLFDDHNFGNGQIEPSLRLVPDYIHGDLDSLRPDVRQHYEALGSTVSLDSNQDNHDMDKCLHLLDSIELEEQTTYSVVIVGAFGGRLDQEMANISSAFKWSSKGKQVLLLSQDSLATVLEPGKHAIYPDQAHEATTCGLLPIMIPCEKVTTAGLKYNTSNAKLMMGSFISSSNEYIAEKIEVETSHPILWTTSLKPSDGITDSAS